MSRNRKRRKHAAAARESAYKTSRLFTVKAAAAAACLVLLFAMTGCGVDDIDISGYGDKTITMTGINGQDIRLSVADLKSMDCITKKTESTSDKIGKVRATGPVLNTVLGHYGRKQTDFDSIRIYAADGYDIKLSSDFLRDNEEIILAFGMDGKPMDEESAPVRIIIPGSDSAYWIRMVEKIECIN